jgi:hypothetical protein
VEVFLAEDEVKRHLLSMGPSEDEVRRRIQLLSDSELELTVKRIDSIRAGRGKLSSALWVIVLLAFIFLMLKSDGGISAEF